MKLNEWLKESFKKTEWKTVYTNVGQAYRSNVMFGTFTYNCRIFLKVSTNKKYQDYQCYFTDGVNKHNLSIEMLATNYPDVIPILEEYKIKW